MTTPRPEDPTDCEALCYLNCHDCEHHALDAARTPAPDLRAALAYADTHLTGQDAFDYLAAAVAQATEDDTWTRTIGSSEAATTTSAPAKMTGTMKLERLRAAGVITDGTYGPFLDPDKVLAALGSATPEPTLDAE